MPSTLVKGGVIVTGIGGLGAGGWAISSYIKSTNNTVKSVLTSKGHRLTSSLDAGEQDAAWNKVEETYKLEVKDSLKIKEEGVVTANEIKTWCSANIEKSYEESTFKKAEKWCVVYSTFGDRLVKDKFVLEATLATLQSRYSNLGDLTSEISKVTPDAGSDNENGRKLKKWCETKVYSSYVDDAFYQTFKGHCAKASAGNGGS